MLEVVQPANSVGQAPSWHVALDRHYDEATLRYRVKFGEGFDFGKLGGKLPGLKGVRSGVSKHGCGSRDGTKSFSARLMWKFRTQNVASEGGQLQAYTYHPSKGGGCGDDQRISSRLTDNRWYTIELTVSMNSPGKDNGSLQIDVDGKQVFSRSNYEWRRLHKGRPAFGINRVTVNSFFGGSHVKDWGHDRDESIFYDDFELVAS